MKLIRQPANTNLCLACCAAMVTDTTLAEVLENVTLSVVPDKHAHLMHRGNFLSTKEMIQYLWSRNKMFGLVARWETPVKLENWNGKLEHDVSMTAAIVTVNSKTIEGCLHAVCFDSESGLIFDPQEHLPQEIENYLISEWCPIQNIPRY